MTAIELDPFEADRALRAPATLQAFTGAGVLAAADVHVACRLAALGGDGDETVALAAALAVRGPRLGHVFVDLATARETTVVDADAPVDVSALPWPEPRAWLDAVAASPLTAVGEDVDAARPLRLLGSRLYLDRYWREERQVAGDLRAFAAAPVGAVDDGVLTDGLARLLPRAERFLPRADRSSSLRSPLRSGPGDDRQRAAAEAAVTRRLAVVAGGPGTGKTTTVARIVALLAEQAAALGRPAPLVALAAPTAKAAQRLGEAVHGEAAALNVSDDVRAGLLGLTASTLHRLLGWRPGSHSRFRHDRGNRLPHDVVVVDETSMVSLWQMARLLEAVRPDARLVLVGDPGQLSSIEAGAVLGDIVGPASGEGIVVLDQVHRFGGGIAELAGAVRDGDADATMAVLRNPPDGVAWLPGDDEDALTTVRRRAVATARAVHEAASAGDAGAALAALGAFRLLCAHRRGEQGVAAWTARIEGWIGAEVAGLAAADRWYVGRPLLQTRNDYGLGLFNGDTGVVIAGVGGRMSAAFPRGGTAALLSPSRLDAVETVYAMTVHKAQGSQFGTAAVLLPDPASRLLTRELLYTAITRAREELILVGGEDAIRAAVARPIVRASGLRERLWGPDRAAGALQDETWGPDRPAGPPRGTA